MIYITFNTELLVGVSFFYIKIIKLRAKSSFKHEDQYQDYRET